MNIPKNYIKRKLADGLFMIIKINLLILLSSVIMIFSPGLKAGGFDDLGNSARAVAMGGAHLAIQGSPSAIFYNPANISSMKNLSLITTYSNLFPGIEDDNLNYFSIGSTIPMDFVGSLGVGGTFLNSALWTEYTLQGSYAREIYDNFCVGGTFKLLGWSADAAPGEGALSYNGFTFDAGAFYSFDEIVPGSDLNMGISIMNITNPSIASNGSESGKLPVRIGAGVAYISRSYGYIVAADIIREGDIIEIKSGAEFEGMKTELFGYYTAFLIRVGYHDLLSADYAKQNGINSGFGIHFDKAKLDYAYIFPLSIQEAGGTHKISLSYNF